MKILAFAGSNSSESINLKLVKFTLSYFEDCDITILNLNDFEMPIFSVDREKSGYPEQVYAFNQYFREHDAIVVSLAENNKTYTAAMKNIIDWCTRVEIDLFQHKPMLLMSSSTGGYAGGNVMAAAKLLFPKFAGNIITTFSLPSFDKTFQNGKIIDEGLKGELEKQIGVFRSELNI